MGPSVLLVTKATTAPNGSAIAVNGLAGIVRNPRIREFALSSIMRESV
jgi:hypothetical protein